jgi:cell division protease FtsH
MGSEPDYSDEVAREIDDEIRRIIEEGHSVARQVLEDHLDDLHRISQVLIERETIDKDQFVGLLAGESEEDLFPAEEPKAPAPPDPETGGQRPQAKPRLFPLPRSAPDTA